MENGERTSAERVQYDGGFCRHRTLIDSDLIDDDYVDIIESAGPSTPALDAQPAIVSARPGRRLRMPARYVDYLPVTVPHIRTPPHK
ncbi:hypothetical protein K503DRAFT_870911 [Rhizopogon vinicolor AM-OR11-026]|uniref:Uncharacterized protein n=1 Tax=Rhizopogon vinicolor AM-OR11-026 TaxID=1314800 RepID=A0A1B7MDN2_9AGAM|nr:hypothetical protein K503DRAFT_870911 [Rhizopogon vinicolor AM-OR11-026]